MKKIKASWIVFGLLTLICIIVFKDYLLLKKAYFFYDISSDGFYLGYPSLYNLADYFANIGIPQWSFKVGMGQNIFPFMLRDPFDIILYIGGKDNVIPLTVYVEVLKIILTGMIFFKYLKLLDLSDYVAVVGSLLFAFCGFITEASPWFVFTFEAFNFALFLYAFELFFSQKKWLLFSFAVFLVCISMPFNLYIYGVFMAFYAIFRHLQTGKFDFVKLRNLFIRLIGITLVGILLSGPFLLQNIWLLLHSPRGAEGGLFSNQLASSPIYALTDKLQFGTCIMRFFSNDILGSGSNFKGWANILEAPLFYCGLPCLLLVPQIFIFLNKRLRIIFIVSICVWLLPIIFPYFRYAFWLFTGDYYRAYSFLVAFLFIYYSIHALEYIFQQRRINIITLLITLLVLLLLLFYPIFIERGNIIKPIQTFTALMLVFYCIVLILINQFRKFSSVKYLFILLLFGELYYSQNITVNKRDSFSIGWLRDNKVLYNDYSNDAVKYIKDQDKSFYRIDKYLEPNTSRYTGLGYSQKQGYNSTASYSPFNELYYIRYLRLMGIVDKHDNKEAQWAIGLVDNPVLESENSVKYYLGQNNAHPVWPEMWDSINHIGDVTIFQNKYVLPFGFGYSHYIKESNFSLESPEQKKFITLQAFVVNDKDIDKVTRLKEFQLKDTVNTQLNFEVFKSKLDDLKKDTLQITESNEQRFCGYVDFSEDKMLYLPIPYDDGWQLIEDVTEVKPVIVNGGMMGIFIEKGRHRIDLFYKLRFMMKGLFMTLIGLILLIGINWKYLKQTAAERKQKLLTKTRTALTGHTIDYYLIPFIISVPVIIYFYFLQCKTNVIYGDDLATFQFHSHLHTFFEKINIPLAAQKYRPIHGLTMHFLIELFQKNLTAYYLFNIGIQTINTLVFARILNLFLKSPYFSLCFSLIFGLSSFSFFNISQLLIGGALEGLAMTWFLFSLFFLLQVLTSYELMPVQKQKGLLYSILFANMSVYTHERYIMLFAFILLIIVLFPSLKNLTIKRKMSLIGVVIVSIFLNVFIKKYIYSLPFLVGTGGANITFSFSSMSHFFVDAILSIFQINSGPEYLIGITYASLPSFDKFFVMLVVGSMLVILFLYLAKTSKDIVLARIKNSEFQKDSSYNQNIRKTTFYIFLFLFILFLLFLIPGISTIRLEQRFLETSFSIFILMIVIAFNTILSKSNSFKYALFLLFSLLFLRVDFTYLNKGISHLYMKYSENDASKFKIAVDQAIIKKNAKTLYYWEKKKDINGENGLIWTLCGGYFFNYYQNNSKNIIFVDSIYQTSGSTIVSSFPLFDRNTDQIIYFNNTVIDITDEYLRDSLKTFIKTIMN